VSDGAQPVSERERDSSEHSPAMHLGDLVTGLANLRPELYGHLDTTALGSMLRSAGVQVGSVYVAGKPREESSQKGVKIECLDVSTTAAIGDEAEAYLRERDGFC
jgi:hypothetical protein